MSGSGRRVVLYIAASLDGFIARPDGAVDWLFTDKDYGYEHFYAGIDTVMMGRKTWEQVLAFGPNPYADRACCVFARRPPAEPHPGVEFTAEEPARLVARLRERPGAHLWLAGGAELVASFRRADLVDEIVVSVHPLLLGNGIPLFPAGFGEQSLRLRQVREFSSGLVQLRYDRERAGSSNGLPGTGGAGGGSPS